jgi:isoquinoline 1-oxidoreductase
MLQMLGAGLVIAVTGPDDADAQERRTGQGGGTGRNSQQITIAARLHIGRDGLITVMSGKVECGQGARAQITQAAAEELHVPTTSIRVILGDTELCPDDGPTVGSFTTPRTIPAVRAAAGAARDLLLGLAAVRWDVGKDLLQARDGKVVHPASGRQATYADLAGDDWARTAAITPPSNVHVTAVENWRVLGTTEPRPNGRDIVVGTHRYPSDIVRPNMLVGKILRAPAIGSKLIDIVLAAAE